MVIAILDANTLYPAPLRDYLLHLAAAGLFKPRWSAEIQEEWIRNLLINRPTLKRYDLEKTRKAMDSAFPDADVEDYQEFISRLILPDPDDRHVLAAAITCNASLIVTNNLKDFPATLLASHSIQAISADEFVLQLIAMNTKTAMLALENQVKLLRNPPLTKEDVLRNLSDCGLQKSVTELKLK